MRVPWTGYTFNIPETLSEDLYVLGRRDPIGFRGATRAEIRSDFAAHLRRQVGMLAILGVAVLALTLLEAHDGLLFGAAALVAAGAGLSVLNSTFSFVWYAYGRWKYMRALLDAASISQTYADFLVSARMRGITRAAD